MVYGPASIIFSVACELNISMLLLFTLAYSFMVFHVEFWVWRCFSDWNAFNVFPSCVCRSQCIISLSFWFMCLSLALTVLHVSVCVCFFSWTDFDFHRHLHKHWDLFISPGPIVNFAWMRGFHPENKWMKDKRHQMVCARAINEILKKQTRRPIYHFLYGK